MSAAPTIDDLEATEVGYHGVPWFPISIDPDAVGKVFIGYRGLPMLLVGGVAGPSQVPYQYSFGLLW